jgi:hypothetical protein
LVVVPAKAGTQRLSKALKALDYAPLLRRALRAIRYANVRFGI